MAGRHPRRTGYPTMVSSLVEMNGIRSFVDLSGRTGEYDYARELYSLGETLKQKVDYFRVPIREGSVPDTDRQMIAILDTLDEAVERARREGTKVYVHCSSGAGRTGLVLGCHLVRHGMQSREALKHLKKLFQPLPGSAHRRIPETDKQKEYILSWVEKDRPRVG
jgi:protein-tyrosine phosphatase